MWKAVVDFAGEGVELAGRVGEMISDSQAGQWVAGVAQKFGDNVEAFGRNLDVHINAFIETYEDNNLQTQNKAIGPAINELNDNVGNLEELETEDSTTYNMRSTSQRSLVKAINSIHRRTRMLENELDIKKLTDLTDTTWDVPKGMVIPEGYGQYSITCDITHTSVGGVTTTFSANALKMGYTVLAPLAAGGSVINYAPFTNNIVAANTANGEYREFGSTDEFTIAFTGGVHATNTDLINLMYSIGELQVEEKELATVDKIKSIDTWAGGVSDLDTGDGIAWREMFAFNDGEDLSGKAIAFGNIYHRVPILAGNGINFTYSDDNQFVKINAKGGGSAENAVSKFTISIKPSTTIWDVLSAAQEAGLNISDWNVINLTGYSSETLGLIYSPWGNGSTGMLRGVNLLNMKVVEEGGDWSTVTIGTFLNKFRHPLPYYSESNVGSFLTIQSNQGVLEPVWTSVPNAEGSEF